MDDPYEVLGVTPDASVEQVRRRYRQLVARHHPDRAVDAIPQQRRAAHDRMAAITAAGGGIEPAPGDPDFDYRCRASSEFTVSNGPYEPGVWTARKKLTRGWWKRT